MKISKTAIFMILISIMVINNVDSNNVASDFALPLPPTPSLLNDIPSGSNKSEFDLSMEEFSSQAMDDIGFLQKGTNKTTKNLRNENSEKGFHFGAIENKRYLGQGFLTGGTRMDNSLSTQTRFAQVQENFFKESPYDHFENPNEAVRFYLF